MRCSFITRLNLIRSVLMREVGRNGRELGYTLSRCLAVVVAVVVVVAVLVLVLILVLVLVCVPVLVVILYPGLAVRVVLVPCSVNWFVFLVLSCPYPPTAKRA